ncbi:Dolichyl-phosphate-mannose-protein mannosyltransferase 2 [Zancudomyces culisetae]|uniref:Dolichyl-phosphate-mannose--protein mannosyltransferase n=1 Tax=Zancudomyces culisetae TaxID=1213189 RepID=A0A1R1PUD2_ZANCU|nr:Dolichyl-phosphate-mannose-protein mannosyltransferase 2 [Zancudomyces culisetae]|eukprot:OMH84513.1 Dolichyl-phosphate-mannose-protein mannosyltransferase 2 [Zancudomyces culisetae]
MSSNFQARLIGHNFQSQPIAVADKSVARFRSLYSGAGLLHSHDHKFIDKEDYQVNAYAGVDDNNLFVINLHENLSLNKHGNKLELLDGDMISLKHFNTSRSMFVPGYPSYSELDQLAVTSRNVTSGSMDSSFLWEIKITKRKRFKKSLQIHPMLTYFTLRNLKHDCYLSTVNYRLPKWAWSQKEVFCSKSQARKSGSLWYVESHSNLNLPNVSMRKHLSSNVIVDFFQLNYAMGRSNNALTADKDKYNAIESPPSAWPFLYHPMRMVGWGDKDIKYYEIGNPLLWWLSSLVCCIFPVIYILLSLVAARFNSHPSMYIHSLRKSVFLNNPDYWFSSKLLWFGWFFHYIPFFIMGRVTYLHHYLPALYFAVLFLALQLYYFSIWLFKAHNTRLLLALAISLIMFAVFCFFFPFTVGYDKSAKNLLNRQWRASWNVHTDPFDLH